MHNLKVKKVSILIGYYKSQEVGIRVIRWSVLLKSYGLL